MYCNDNLRKNQGVDASDTVTNRPTNHEAEHSETSARPCGTDGALGGDSTVIQTEHPTPAARPKKMNRAYLAELDKRLSGRDRDVLRAIQKHRFLLTGQIQRLYFAEGSSAPANTRAANRALKKLNEYGLINSLKRRIGGVRAGSASLIWHLTEPGHRILHLGNQDTGPRRRFEEPSPMFLEHTLAVAECAVQLICICRPSEDLELVSVDSEPTCWRPFTVDGKVVYLKPDLFAITTYEDYEDQWFIEIDLGTESPAQVALKCAAYYKYYCSGIEQRESGMFPLVVWIVPDEGRKQRLEEAIQATLPKHPKMFLVITPDKLEKMIRQVIGPEALC